MTEGNILFTEYQGVYVLKFMGDVRINICQGLSQLADRDIHEIHSDDFFIDLSEADNIDSTALGLLAKIALLLEKEYGYQPVIYCDNENIYKLLTTMGFDQIFSIVQEPLASDYESITFATLLPSTSNLHSKIEAHRYSLDAHRILMSLNPANKIRFEAVVQALESELHDKS